MKKFRKMLTVSVMMMTVLAFVVVVSPASAATATDGDLIKMSGLSSVYYLKGGKRYVFPNEQTYFSWYSDWSGVKTISASELQSYPLTANVVTRPGTDLVKITTDPTVYAVEPGGVLKSIVSEANAIALWGANWADMVVDVPDSFFVNYTVGTPLTAGTYPVGTLVNPTGTMDIYYFDGTNYRKFNNEAAFLANKMQFEHIVTTDKTVTAGGAGVAAAETTLMNVGNTGAASTVTTPVGGSGLSVALASTTAPAGTIIAGQAIANLASFNLTAAADGDVTVTNFKVKRTGVSADATLSAVYLYDGITKLTDSATVSSTMITWNNSAGIIKVPAGTTKTITVKSNIAVVTGETVGVAINAAADITAGGATISGSFPVSGNLQSIAGDANTLAHVDFAISTSPTGDGAPNPQTGFELWRNTLTVGTRAVYLNYITFRNIGSVSASDVVNFSLYVKGVKVGNTVAAMDANGYVTFDLTASPLKMETGSNEMKILADIVGGSTRTITMSLRQPADMMVVDSQYNANVLIRGNASTTSAVYSVHSAIVQTIGTGSLTITKKTDSPSGNVVLQGSNVTLATYELKAYGEDVKVETLEVAIVEDDADNDYSLRNGALYADGVQVGSTASIPSDNDSPAYVSYNLGSSLVVHPGTPVTLTVKADIYDDAGAANGVVAGDTIQVVINDGVSNAQRMTSLGYFSVPGAIDNTTAGTPRVYGTTLTVADGSLVLAANQVYGNQTVVVPYTKQKMGDFTLSSGNTDSVNLTTLVVDFTGEGGFDPSDDLSDVYLVYGADTTVPKPSIVDGENTWTINKTMAPNTNMNVSVYANIASSAYVAGGAADTMIAGVKVAGNTITSAAAVNTNVNAVLDGQKITASGGGTLTVQLADDTPAASIAVAGSQPDNGSIKLKLTAASEDVYVKGIRFRVDVTADDVAMASVDLYAGTTTLAKVSVTKTWNADSTKPGYVDWTLTGTDRILVPKDGTVYVVAKPTYVASNQGAATGKTPALFLSDLDAEGVATLVPTSSTPNLLLDSGVILKANASATFAQAVGTINGNILVGDTTIVTVDSDTFVAGDIIFIDITDAAGTGDGDNFWNAAYEELLVVLSDGGTDLVVERGAFGTTARAYTDAANNDDLYILNTATTSINNIAGSATKLVNTKPTIALAVDSPSGATTGGTQKVLYKFTVTAAANTLDPAENKVSLGNIVITNTKSGTTVKNLKVYPEAMDQNATYVVTATGLTTTTWNMAMADMAGNLYQIPEGTSRTFVVRGDVGSGTNASNTLEMSIASILDGGNVTWTDDGSTTSNWVNQAGASYISGSALTYGASSGTIDAGAPTISSILITSAAADDGFANGDTILITFSEMMDPTTIGNLVPGAATAAITNLATGDVSIVTAASDLIRIKNIIDIDVGNTTFATSDVAGACTGAINAAGTTLTLTMVGAMIGVAADGTEGIIGGSAAITMTDINGTVATAAGSNAATVNSIDL